jgi:flagellar hook assembly protein FlgD
MAIYPNPFSGSTTIDLNLSTNASVVISMFNVLGELVYTSNQGSMSAGNHNISLDGTSLQAGIYYINANVDGYTLTQKVSVIK